MARASAPLEREIERLNHEIERQSERAVRLQDEAVATREKLARDHGPNFREDKGALAELGDMFGRVDDALDDLKRLQEKKAEALKRFVDAHPSSRGAAYSSSGPGAATPDRELCSHLPLASGDELEALRQAAVSGTTLRTGPGLRGGQFNMAAVGPDTFAPAEIPGYEFPVRSWLYERTRILSYIPIIGVDHAQATYYRVNQPADQAAVVAPGAAKPQSDPQVEAITVPIRKIAHWGSVDDEVIKDYGAWSTVIANEFFTGLIHAENDELLNGDGTGQHLLGLLQTPGILDVPASAETQLDTLLDARNALRTGAAFCDPTVIILNPSDWRTISGLKNTLGNYLVGEPLETPSARLWDIPVVQTTQIAQGTAVMANLQLAANIYLREPAVWQVNQMPGNPEWSQNQTLVRAEERLALAVERPAAVAKITL